MLLGAVGLSTGTGLLVTLRSNTHNAQLIGYQLLAGFGGGFCHQIPYTSILLPLPASDAVSGSALCSFLNSLGAILGIIAAQAIFATLLIGNLDKVQELDSLAVFLAGPNNIGGAVPFSLIVSVRDAYSDALHGTFILSLVAAVLCAFCSLGVEWKGLAKKECKS
ncbi:putative mfs transporter protein [Rosellinia necatrix]|uniref:Putative mfs transporter protein n=1 Tax=Rosellinia necatrix TaxID=77044 RepID=A0A1W2TJH3_ROSNE|nr:putative mfs transporter protein [Rosellinia necatrix]